jgi:hypothetical protein
MKQSEADDLFERLEIFLADAKTRQSIVDSGGILSSDLRAKLTTNVLNKLALNQFPVSGDSIVELYYDDTTDEFEAVIKDRKGKNKPITISRRPAQDVIVQLSEEAFD